MGKENLRAEDFRMETDSMGEMRVPAAADYGAQTARALENFPVSGLHFSRRFIRALGLIKKHAAATNAQLALLKPDLARAIEQAAQEVCDGKWDEQFVVDIFQSGPRPSKILGHERSGRAVHPNDDVNRGQSSNDVIPTAMNLAAFEGLERDLIPALSELRDALAKKAEAFND